MAVTEDDLDQIHAELTRDRVYVHPSLEGEFTEAQLRELEQAADEQGLYVVAWPFRRNDEYAGSADDLLARLHDRHPEDGLYLSNGVLSSYGQPLRHSLEGREYGGYAGGSWHPFTVQDVLRAEEHGTLGSFYVRTVELLGMPDAEVRELADEAREERSTTVQPDHRAEEPGALDGVPAWTWALVLVPLVGAVAWRVASSRRAPTTPTVLPPSAIARIREAHDERLEHRARAELLALGEAIDSTEITPGAHRASWQQALDHYDAARRVLDGPDPEVLDVLGAIVLCERGSAALVAAAEGRPWTPRRPCFLNPLHGAAERQRKVAYDGHTVTAPLCRACDAALARDQAPDILDVARRGRPRHYFETDAQPWAETGYGALHDDLVERLHRRR